MNCVLGVFTGPALNMKLTLSSFLCNTLKSKLRPRDGNGKRMKKKARRLSEVRKKQSKSASQRSRLEFHINEYQHQKQETDQGEIKTEISHFTGYKISSDHEKRFQG